MEKLVAKARVYYIVAYGRDATMYSDKKWSLGTLFLTERRLIFKYLDKYSTIQYAMITELNERDKHPHISPPMGWSRGSILELQHYEDESKRHVLITLISADFDVITKLKAIIGEFALQEVKQLSELHFKVLLLLSMGIRDGAVIGYLLGLKSEEYENIVKDLKHNGLIYESMELTSEGRKEIYKLKKRI